MKESKLSKILHVAPLRKVFCIIVQEPSAPIEMYYLPQAAQCLPVGADVSRTTPSYKRKVSGDSSKLKKTRLKWEHRHLELWCQQVNSIILETPLQALMIVCL